MNDLSDRTVPPPARPPQKASRPRWHWWCALGMALIAMGLAAGWAALWVVKRAEPEARRLVVKSLSDHLHCRVELDQLHVSLLHGMGGLEVTGSGLRIESIDGTNHTALSGVPMLTAEGFAFRAHFNTLLHSAPDAIDVFVQNVIVTVPPPSAAAQPKSPPSIPGILLLHSVTVHGAKLIFEPAQSGASPVEYDLREVRLEDQGDARAFAYNAVLLGNALIPEIHADGHLGPWASSSPRETPVDGAYQLDHVNLSLISGLSGTASSKGSFHGTLSQIAADAGVEIPDFALSIGARPLALHVRGQVQLDSPTGNATIASLTAIFLKTAITATGTVTHMPAGLAIEADKQISGRSEDMLAMFSRARIPVMNGALEYRGHMSLPPGDSSVITRSHVRGVASIRGAAWADKAMQQQIDAVSQRAQGKAEVAKGDPAKIPVAPSSMAMQVAIDNGVMSLTHVIYSMPGASVVMQGSYSLLGGRVEMHGVARTAARASQLTTGWKSFLLKPVDPLFRKHGAGAELPVKLTGDLAHPEFGTDFKNRDEDKRKTEHIVTTQHK